eukprot:EG_transcript_10952
MLWAFLFVFAVDVSSSEQAGPAPAAPHFLLLGDWGCDCPVQYAVAAGLRQVAHGPALRAIVSLGDNFYPQGLTGVADKRWAKTFERVYSAIPLQRPWHSVLGNHDWASRDVTAYFTRRRLTPRWQQASYYYSRVFPVDNVTVQFLFIDTMMLLGKHKPHAKHDAAAHGQLAWLNRTLADSTADWVLVAGHHPVFCGGRYPTDERLRLQLLPLFQQHGVAAYFSGHDHQMQHISTGGIQYFINGNGGQNSNTRKEHRSPPRGSQRFYGNGGGFIAVEVRNSSSLRVHYYSAGVKSWKKQRPPQPVYCYDVRNPRRPDRRSRSSVCPFVLPANFTASQHDLAQWLFGHAVTPAQIRRLLAAGVHSRADFAAAPLSPASRLFSGMDRVYLQDLSRWLRAHLRSSSKLPSSSAPLPP